MASYTQGQFKLNNPKKYLGNKHNVIYRSSWELRFMMYLDNNPSVVQWASEEFFIPYKSPIDNKYHRYFPDFWIKKINREGKEDVVVVEIKPSAQTKQPKKRKMITKKYLYEVKTWGVNVAKWKAAKRYCDERNWHFQILTEKELGIKF